MADHIIGPDMGSLKGRTNPVQIEAVAPLPMEVMARYHEVTISETS
jgi:hypothetical protein